VRNGRNPHLRPLVIGIATALILLIGFSRIYLGAHFLSDVIAGFLAGGAWLFACITVMAYVERRQALLRDRAL
jgi:membrane-associated phospholipid phosphatase